MATTTTSTSTSTTAAPPPPPPPPRRRVQRPHRPYNRRPVDDYYYDEDEIEDDYYEERLNRRNKPRLRPRKPQVQLEYDDEYDDDKRILEKPLRRNRNRDRYRDEDELGDEDYDERRSRPSARRGKPSSGSGTALRSKPQPRKPARVDERRSFNEEEPRRVNGRRRNEKRTTPSTVAVLDELDEYEKPYELDQEEAAEEQTPQKVKTTPKPLTEFITPKAAPASVYSRPRAPPRIARPVPINEKNKYSYPVQKNTDTKPAQTVATSDQEDQDYYQDPEQDPPQEDEDYEQPPQTTRNLPRRRTANTREQKPTRPTIRKPVLDKKPLLDDQDYHEAERQETPKRKRPQVRTRGPPPDTDFVDDVEYDERPIPVRAQRVRTKSAPRKPAPRPRQPIVQDEEEDNHEPTSEELPTRTRVNSVISATSSRRNQKLSPTTRQRALPAPSSTARTTTTTTSEATQSEDELPQSEHDDPQVDDVEEAEEPLAPAAPPKSLRSASVRVVKRPFLPSRGGSPYLPRGLQPVGAAVRQQLDSDARTTDSTPIDMGSTISGVHLLEHGAPLLRGEMDSDDVPLTVGAQLPYPPRTTLPPRSALPTSITPRRPDPHPAKLNLDELYENDYDVTLNDALDPTLKPLTPQHSHQSQLQHQLANYQSRPYASAYAVPASNPFAGHSNNYRQASIYQNHSPTSSIASASPSQSPTSSQSQSQLSNFHSDSYFSSTDIRRRAVAPAQIPRSNRHEYATRETVSNSQVSVQPIQHFYEDFAF